MLVEVGCLAKRGYLSGIGAKYVCFGCRKAVNVSSGATGPVRCTDCGAELVVLPQRFRPPKKREAKKWAAAQYLVAQGFWYQHLNPANFPDWTSGGYGNHVRFPEELRVAKEFVEAYRTHKGKNL
jgi:LSD1 subclass zinc finger protein